MSHRTNYYQPFFSPDGERLHVRDKWSCIRYWNDACWHRSVPENSAGLTYLDVGANFGYYCLRFEQRGGLAVGLDFDLGGHPNLEGSSFPAIGCEHLDQPLQEIRDMHRASYRILNGGFDERHRIVPDVPEFDVVSCLNVIEYMEDQQACIKSLFEKAIQRVIVATDVNPNGDGFRPEEPRELRRVSGLEELLGWMEWPAVYWLFSVPGDDSPSKDQAFIVATNPSSTMPAIDASQVHFDIELPETEKFYRAARNSSG